MKKIFAILLLVSLSLLSLSIVALADDTTTTPQPTTGDGSNNSAAQPGSSGVNLYLDYSRINETNASGIYSNSITIGMDYNQDFLVGASYTAGSNYGYFYSNPVPDGFSQNSYMVYGGYNILTQNNSSLGIIASYWDVQVKGNSSLNNDYSSVGIGFKGSCNFGTGNISLLYTYGVSNTLKTSSTSYTDKTFISLAELKGTYYFNETVGMHAAYRWTQINSDYLGSTNFNLSGYALGVDFKF